MSDEVILTFLETVLKSSDLCECYYWISEYYYSGYQRKTWQLLLQIFYDFYAIKYPKLEGLIVNEYNKWKRCKCILPIMTVVLQLYERTPCCDVFLARHMPAEKFVKKGRPPKWISTFPPEDKDMLLCIHFMNIPGIHFHMDKYNCYDLYALVCQYFQIVQNMQLKKDKLETIPFSNKKHIILVLILYLHRPVEKIILDNQVSAPLLADITWIENINNLPVSPVYHTLPVKRLYSISTTIGAFDIRRFDTRCPSVKKLLGFYWEFFASFSPLWRERFRHYSAKRDKKTCSMVFKTDDDLEKFGEKYNYEPDEQSNETQNKSIINIEQGRSGKWIEDIFGIHCTLSALFPPYMASS